MADATPKAREIMEKLQRLGFCQEEGEQVLEAARAYDIARLALSSAKKNTNAGRAGTGAGVVALGGCALSFSGVGLAVCVGAGSFAILSGALWTESASEAEQVAEALLDDAEDDLNDAMKDLCKCIGEHD